jgi:hypothetical protein
MPVRSKESLKLVSLGLLVCDSDSTTDQQPGCYLR